MAHRLNLHLLVIATLSTLLSLFQCSPTGCHHFELEKKTHEKLRSRGWSGEKETDAQMVLPVSPEFRQGFDVSTGPLLRTLLSGSDFKHHKVVTSRHLPVLRLNHNVPIYVARRKLGRARSYIGRRAATDVGSKTAFVKRGGAVDDGTNRVTAGTGVGDERRIVPVNRNGQIQDRVDFTDDGGNTEIQKGDGMIEVKCRGEGLTVKQISRSRNSEPTKVAQNSESLKQDDDKNTSTLEIDDRKKEIRVRRGLHRSRRTAAGVKLNLEIISKSPLRISRQLRENVALRNEAKKQSNGWVLCDFVCTGIDPTREDDRKRLIRSTLGLASGSVPLGKSLPLETIVYPNHEKRSDQNGS